MKTFAGAFIFILFLGILANTPSFIVVKGETQVSGILTSDTTWNKTDSPYLLTGNILVEKGVTLTVEAETTLSFNDYYIRVNGSLSIQSDVTINIEPGFGGSFIQVNGLLTMKGTKTNPIKVNGAGYSYAWIAPLEYSSIIFQPSSTNWNEQTNQGSTIENTILSKTNIIIKNSPKITNCQFLNESEITISGGSPTITKNYFTGQIDIKGGSPTISNNNIENGQIFYNSDYNGDFITISNNVISDARGESSGTGIWFLGGSYGGHVLVENNLITNSDVGIMIMNPNKNDLKTTLTIQKNTIANNIKGITINNRYSPTITNNNFINNPTNLELTRDAKLDINASNNWWGTTNTQVISQSIIDFEEDFNLGKVTFIPILNSLNPEAPEITTIPTPTPLPSNSPTSTPPNNGPTTSPTTLTPIELEAILAVSIIIVVLGAGTVFLLYLMKKK